MTALFFDLDDTIISHDAPVRPAWEQTYKHFADKLQPYSMELITENIYELAKKYWSNPENHKIGRLNLLKARQTIVGGALKQLKINDTNLINDISVFFDELREKLITPFPKAIETLQTFRDRGIQMALITNGATETQYKKIERFNLRQFFKEIVVEGEFGIGKPHPEGFLHALKSLKTKPEDTWMVGDSLEFDIAGAKPLGIRTAWNNWSRKPLPQNAPAVPDLEINSIKELTKMEL